MKEEKRPVPITPQVIDRNKPPSQLRPIIIRKEDNRKYWLSKSNRTWNDNRTYNQNSNTEMPTEDKEDSFLMFMVKFPVIILKFVFMAMSASNNNDVIYPRSRKPKISFKERLNYYFFRKPPKSYSVREI